MSRSVHDLGGLDNLRAAAKSGDQGALEEAAKQFEAIFVQMMLKSMRKAQDAMADKDSPFNSEQVKFYRDMHDQQLATDLSTNGSIGLADIIVQQMSLNQGVMPASAVRNDGNLSMLHKQAMHQASLNRNLTNEIDANASLKTQVEAAPATFTTKKQAATKQAAFDSPASFIQSLYPKAKAAAERLGISAKALISQAAVETGWGKFMIHQGDGNNAHNLFGIKADKRWQGEKAVVDTLEFENNMPKKQQAAFRSYNDFEEALHDYVDFVSSNPRYKNAVEQAGNPQRYFTELQRAGYATDPNYADKIMSVYNSSTMSDLLP
nr:flagellar assembly peptidoglycan hydrolase FlgJ [Ningiella ruwaisensis]